MMGYWLIKGLIQVSPMIRSGGERFPSGTLRFMLVTSPSPTLASLPKKSRHSRAIAPWDSPKRPA